MALKWTDLGNGQQRLTITDDEGKVPPAHVTGTKDEILNKLADSKINGDRRIHELKGVTVNMSASERMQAVADLRDPAKVDTAITAVVERAIGPISEIRQDRAEEREERQNRLAVEAATAFAQTTPEWFPSEFNRNTLVEYMKRFGMNPTKIEDYTKAFKALKGANLLQARPAGEDEGETTNDGTGTEAERTAPAPVRTPATPTRYSTGVRSSDISGTPTRATKQLKYSREQIDRMGTVKYKELMQNDPKFSEAIEHYAALDRQRQRRAS